MREKKRKKGTKRVVFSDKDNFGETKGRMVFFWGMYIYGKWFLEGMGCDVMMGGDNDNNNISRKRKDR